MINDLSLLLRDLLSDPALPEPLLSAQKRFDRPTDPYTFDQNTVNLFLYDVRENIELRSNEPVVERLNGEARVHRPPLRVACSYLATAWIPGAPGETVILQEQLLLGQVLGALSRFSTIPDSFLAGTGLAGQEPLLPIITTQADGIRNPAEFWTALGNKLRPSLSVTVTVSMGLFEPEVVPVVLTRELDMEPLGRPASREQMFRIGGRVTDAASVPVAGAAVSIVERGLLTSTDADGLYNLGLVAPGAYTLHVETATATSDVAISIPATAGNNYDVQLT